MTESRLWRTGGDLRHVINVMQTWRMRTDTLAYGDIAGVMKNGGKETSTMQQSVFEVSNDWFLDASKHRNATLGERMDMYFFDKDLIPLLVQENYLKTKIVLPQTEQQSNDSSLHMMDRFAAAADSIAEADLVNNAIRSQQQWSLLPVHGILSTVRAGYSVRGVTPNFFCNEIWRRQTFTKALGHMSTCSKKLRLLVDVERCMKHSTSANRTEVGMDYIPLLRARLTEPLLNRGVEGVDEVLAFMEGYLFTREEFDAVCQELRVSELVSQDAYAKVDSKVKAALTRKYNKESHRIAFVKGKAADSLSTKGGKKNIGRSGDFEKEEDEMEEEDDDEEEEAEGDDAVVAKKAGGTGKEQKGGSSSSSKAAGISKAGRSSGKSSKGKSKA